MDAPNYDYTDMDPHVVVIDIETKGLGIDCVITNIGAVYGNVFTGEVEDRYYRRIDHNQAGRVTDQNTLAFWEKVKVEHPKAYDEAFNESLPRVPLYDALVELNHFINSKYVDKKAAHVFGNGPEFDNARLEHAMKQYNLRTSWYFGGNQSLRTVVWMGRLILNIDPKYSAEFKGIPHIAIDDAEHEFLTIHEIVKTLRDTLKLAR